MTWERLIRELTAAEPELSAHGHEEPQRDRRSAIVFSLLALVAHARELRSGEVQPLVPTQVQLWVRELRRLGRVVGEDPAFTWLDEPVESAPSLPAVHCNECGESGWIAVHNPAKDSLVQSKGGILQLKKAPEEIYREWFATGDRRTQHGQYVVVIVPVLTGGDAPEPGEQRRLATEDLYIYPQSLVIGRDPNACPLTQAAHSIRVRISNETERDFENARKRLRHRLKELSKAESADKVAEAARDEVEIELKILRSRGADHSRKQTLELLTDHGLLPNYAFPERGVPFYGSVYNPLARELHRDPSRLKQRA